MEKQFVTTSASPHITLDVSGDLRVKGQDSNEVTAKSDSPEDFTLEARDDNVMIHSLGDCTVRVPRMAYVLVQAVHGDAVMKALDGELTIQAVDGSLELRNVGETRIARVNGDLTAKNIDGNLNIDQAAGDLFIRSVQGDFSAKTNGNLTLTDVGGRATSSADGNILLRLDPAPGHDYEFSALGNVFCRISQDASVEISVPKASLVRADLPGIHATAPVQAPYALTLGEGDSKLTLTANGSVTLDTHAPDWDMEDFDIDLSKETEGIADAVSQQINDQVESQMRMIEDNLNATMASLSARLSSAKLSEVQARRVEERARETSQRAAERAQDRMRRAQEKMEQKMAAMQRKMEMKNREREHTSRHAHRHWSFNVPTPPIPPSPAGEPVSEDERLMILHMLEQKKITMEEAEQLLSALEGKEQS
jgi:SHOCT-like domain